MPLADDAALRRRARRRAAATRARTCSRRPEPTSWRSSTRSSSTPAAAIRAAAATTFRSTAATPTAPTTTSTCSKRRTVRVGRARQRRAEAGRARLHRLLLGAAPALRDAARRGRVRPDPRSAAAARDPGAGSARPPSLLPDDPAASPGHPAAKPEAADSRRFSLSPSTSATTSTLALQRGAADLRRQQVVDLEDPGRVVELDLDPHRPLLAGLDPHLVDRRGGDRVDPLLARLERDPRAALRHVERVGDADHAGLERVGLAAAAVADDRVQDLGDHDAALRLPVGAGEQPRQRLAWRGRGCRPRGRRGGSTCRRRAAAPRRRRRPRRRAGVIPWSATIAGSTPALTSSRSSRRAMLSTICMWTQEWSDIPSRSDWTWAMYHQARTSSSALTASRKPSSLRLPRVGARTRPPRPPLPGGLRAGPSGPGDRGRLLVQELSRRVGRLPRTCSSARPSLAPP